MELRVAPLPPGKDPDEIARDEPETWRRAIEDAPPFAEFLLRRAMDARVELDPASYDRLFPNQDTVPTGSSGVGNLIAMLQVATLPADLTEKNLRLFAAEVMPYLRGEQPRTARRQEMQPAK